MPTTYAAAARSVSLSDVRAVMMGASPPRTLRSVHDDTHTHTYTQCIPIQHVDLLVGVSWYASAGKAVQRAYAKLLSILAVDLRRICARARAKCAFGLSTDTYH